MQVARDLAYGARVLLRHRGFTTAAVATLALGIGISTAVLTIVDTVVFRPLPYGDPSRLVKISGNAAGIPADDMALLDYLDIRAQNTVFEAVAADDGGTYTVEHAGVSQAAAGAVVSHDWVSTLRVRPGLGRAFTIEEAEPGRDAVVVLTHAYWRRRFGGDPGVLGTDLRIDGRAHTIVGVLPANVFRYGADFVTPLVPSSYNADRASVNLDVFARLRPGVTIAQARAEIDSIGSRLQQAYPATNRDRRFSVIALDKHYASLDGTATRGLLLVLGAVVLLLLIACANVASLLLARMLARYRECVVRVALGATRRRLVGQFLVENLLLFAAGGLCGAAIGRWLLDTLVRFATREGYLLERMTVVLDARILLLTLLASLALGTAFGVAVAASASRVDVNEGLRESTYSSAGGRGRRRVRRALIIAELAVSLVLLIGFNLVGRSFMRLQATDVGFDPDRLIETAADGGRVFPAAVSFWRTAIDQALSVPGVRAAAAVSRPPLRGSRQRVLDVEGHAEAPDNDASTVYDLSISAGYFDTMGIRLIAGREFDDRDSPSGPPVVIVSETLAQRYFAGRNPIGRRVKLRELDSWECCSSATPVAGVWREIVGVVADVRQRSVEEAPRPTTYRPYTQIVEHDMYLMVRADSRSALPPMMAALRSRMTPPAADTWTEPRLTHDVISGSESLRRRRFMLILLGTFAALAVALASVGLYGIVAGSIAERRREIGVRVALGATPSAIVAQVQLETLRLCLVSFVIGTAAAYVLSRYIASLLYDVSAVDTVTYVAVALFLAAVALGASYVPARRAARTPSLDALREY